MKKISTLFKKNPENLALIIDEVNPENQWVIDGEGIATRKFNGTAAAIIKGVLYKRYDVRKGRQAPEGAIPCQEPDAITGHWPHWVKVDFNSKEDHYFIEGWANLLNVEIVTQELFDTGHYDGTYELCGPKVQGNPERLPRHLLVKHGEEKLIVGELTFENLKDFLEANDVEGIVFHHKIDGRMCKIRKSDFGIKR